MNILRVNCTTVSPATVLQEPVIVVSGLYRISRVLSKNYHLALEHASYEWSTGLDPKLCATYFEIKMAKAELDSPKPVI